MTHNVCTGCGGISENPGVCQTDKCLKNGSSLASCACEDGSHTGAKDEGSMNAGGSMEENSKKTEDSNPETPAT